jgi:hypothetical protein
MLVSYIVLILSPRNSDGRRRDGRIRSNHFEENTHIYILAGAKILKGGGSVAATVHAKSGTVDRRQNKIARVHFVQKNRAKITRT